jgi:hypothetical protein
LSSVERQAILIMGEGGAVVQNGRGFAGHTPMVPSGIIVRGRAKSLRLPADFGDHGRPPLPREAFSLAHKRLPIHEPI